MSYGTELRQDAQATLRSKRPDQRDEILMSLSPSPTAEQPGPGEEREERSALFNTPEKLPQFAGMTRMGRNTVVKELPQHD